MGRRMKSEYFNLFWVVEVVLFSLVSCINMAFYFGCVVEENQFI
jgi:hypothetical protein